MIEEDEVMQTDEITQEDANLMSIEDYADFSQDLSLISHCLYRIVRLCNNISLGQKSWASIYWRHRVPITKPIIDTINIEKT